MVFECDASRDDFVDYNELTASCTYIGVVQDIH